jgi:hypothetical protein
VIGVKLRFERWLDGRSLDADAFIDPGADETYLSLRWVGEQAGRKRNLRPQASRLDPYEPARYRLEERSFVVMGGCELELSPAHPVLLMAQPPMAGFEDLLLGRDFLVAHRLLVVLDGAEETISILRPADEDNCRRRERVLDALDLRR